MWLVPLSSSHPVPFLGFAEPEGEVQSLGYIWSLTSLYVGIFLRSCPIVIEVTPKGPFPDTRDCLPHTGK